MLHKPESLYVVFFPMKQNTAAVGHTLHRDSAVTEMNVTGARATSTQYLHRATKIWRGFPHHTSGQSMHATI